MFEIPFVHGYLFYGLPVLLLTVAASFWIARKQKNKARQRYADEHLLAKDRSNQYANGPGFATFCWGVGLSLILAGAAAPVLQSSEHRVASGTVDVIVVTDVSRSMAAEEYADDVEDAAAELADGGGAETGEFVDPGAIAAFGSRLGYANYVVATQMMPELQGNRIGFVSYAGEGWLQVDLSEDFLQLQWVMENWVKVGSAPGEGSNFVAGLTTAIQAFRESAARDEGEYSNRERVIVLFSDGGFTGDADQLRQIASMLQEEHIELVIVGLGGLSAVPIPIRGPEGQLTGYVQRDNQAVLTSFENASLAALQAATGATYIRLLPGSADSTSLSWSSTLASEHLEIGQRHWFQIPLFTGIAIIWMWLFSGMVSVNRKEY